MREFLKKLIENKKNKVEELRNKIKVAETADEVRSLGATLDSVLEELNAAKEQLDELDKSNNNDTGEDDKGDDNQRGVVITKTESRGFNPLDSYSQKAKQNKSEDTDPYDTEEYRKAFMNFVCRNVPIPNELRPVSETRTNAVTTVTDASAVIPTSILGQIITELKSYGNVYGKVLKTNVQGGVRIPILSLKPTATWIGESTPSETKNIKADEYISFSYYGLECKIAQTLLVNVVTLSVFQDLFVPLAVEAMTIALEKAVISGSGSGQPTGILTDSRVPASNVITLTATEITNWSSWKKKVFAKMKKAYRKGEFFMAQSTFDSYIDGMVDLNQQPIGRVNYGIEGEEVYRFGGKNVEIVEDDIIASYDTAGAGDVIAVFVDLKNYVINSNLEMQTTKWVDNDTNEIKNKCTMICDGKLIDPYGVLIIKKGEA